MQRPAGDLSRIDCAYRVTDYVPDSIIAHRSAAPGKANLRRLTLIYVASARLQPVLPSKPHVLAGFIGATIGKTGHDWLWAPRPDFVRSPD